MNRKNQLLNRILAAEDQMSGIDFPANYLRELVNTLPEDFTELLFYEVESKVDGGMCSLVNKAAGKYLHKLQEVMAHLKDPRAKFQEDERGIGICGLVYAIHFASVIASLEGEQLVEFLEGYFHVLKPNGIKAIKFLKNTGIDNPKEAEFMQDILISVGSKIRQDKAPDDLKNMANSND